MKGEGGGGARREALLAPPPLLLLRAGAARALGPCPENAGRAQTASSREQPTECCGMLSACLCRVASSSLGLAECGRNANAAAGRRMCRGARRAATTLRVGMTTASACCAHDGGQKQRMAPHRRRRRRPPRRRRPSACRPPHHPASARPCSRTHWLRESGPVGRWVSVLVRAAVSHEPCGVC